MASMGSMRRAPLCALKNPMLGTCPRCYTFVAGICFHTLTAALASTLASISISTYKILAITKIGDVRNYRSFAGFLYATLDGTP